MAGNEIRTPSGELLAQTLKVADVEKTFALHGGHLGSLGQGRVQHVLCLTDFHHQPYSRLMQNPVNELGQPFCHKSVPETHVLTAMRGQLDPQSSMFHCFSPESYVPADHPLRWVKKLADRALAAISADLDAFYTSVGRPSIPPERLLKGQVLIVLYLIRSDRRFCEQFDYNLLFRWFLDMDLESANLDQSNFSRLRERLVVTDIARRFFDEVVCLARRKQLLSSDHFTVDGILIDAWASFKSFKRKDGEPPKDGVDGAGMVDFKGEKRSNSTSEHGRSGLAPQKTGQRPAGEAQLWRACAHGEPQRIVQGHPRDRIDAGQTPCRTRDAHPGASPPTRATT